MELAEFFDFLWWAWFSPDLDEIWWLVSLEQSKPRLMLDFTLRRKKSSVAVGGQFLDFLWRAYFSTDFDEIWRLVSLDPLQPDGYQKAETREPGGKRSPAGRLAKKGGGETPHREKKSSKLEFAISKGMP